MIFAGLREGWRKPFSRLSRFRLDERRRCYIGLGTLLLVVLIILLVLYVFQSSASERAHLAMADGRPDPAAERLTVVRLRS